MLYNAWMFGGAFPILHGNQSTFCNLFTWCFTPANRVDLKAPAETRHTLNWYGKVNSIHAQVIKVGYHATQSCQRKWAAPYMDMVRIVSERHNKYCMCNLIHSSLSHCWFALCSAFHTEAMTWKTLWGQYRVLCCSPKTYGWKRITFIYTLNHATPIWCGAHGLSEDPGMLQRVMDKSSEYFFSLCTSHRWCRKDFFLSQALMWGQKSFH